MKKVTSDCLIVLAAAIAALLFCWLPYAISICLTGCTVVSPPQPQQSPLTRASAASDTP